MIHYTAEESEDDEEHHLEVGWICRTEGDSKAALSKITWKPQINKVYNVQEMF